jgi:hypothetical protein
MNRVKMLTVAIACGAAAPALAQLTIDDAHKFSWAENAGWMNWADAGNGAEAVEVHGTFLSGYIWCENIGWLDLGDGSPANGSKYANVNGTDFGVNLAQNGGLTGMAWAENVGWVNFAGGAMANPAKPARIDGANSRFRGYAWAPNIGWINLDDAEHYVGLGDSCWADCNGDGTLDLFDFLCFQNAFVAEEAYADCETNGVFDLFDFLCYINRFNDGC